MTFNCCTWCPQNCNFAWNFYESQLFDYVYGKLMNVPSNIYLPITYTCISIFMCNCRHGISCNYIPSCPEIGVHFSGRFATGYECVETNISGTNSRPSWNMCVSSLRILQHSVNMMPWFQWVNILDPVSIFIQCGLFFDQNIISWYAYPS